MKKLLGFVLAIALTVSGISVAPASAQAVEGNALNKVEKQGVSLSIYPDEGSAVAGVENTSQFTVLNGDSTTMIYVYTQYKAPGTMAVYSSTGTVLDSWQFADGDYLETSDGIYYIADPWTLAAGSYYLGLTFDQSTEYILEIYQAASISSRSITVTKGFSKTLKITPTSGSTITKVTWSSNNTKVATVKNGKVTGKKKGSTTVYAVGYDSDNVPFILRCKVTVRNNEYTNSKMSISDIPYGQYYTNVTKVSYDKKGNLVVKAQLGNRSYHNFYMLKGIKIVVKDASGKKVATYKQSKKTISIPSGTIKTVTFKIPKKKVKKNKDIGGGSVSFKAPGYYKY